MSFVIANRRCEFLIAPDMNSKNDRYRSHNARCGKPNKKYTPGYRDVAFTDVLYDPEAMDRHGKPLTDENPVRTDRDERGLLSCDFHDRRLNGSHFYNNFTVGERGGCL